MRLIAQFCVSKKRSSVLPGASGLAGEDYCLLHGFQSPAAQDARDRQNLGGRNLAGQELQSPDGQAAAGLDCQSRDDDPDFDLDACPGVPSFPVCPCAHCHPVCDHNGHRGCPAASAHPDHACHNAACHGGHIHDPCPVFPWPRNNRNFHDPSHDCRKPRDAHELTACLLQTGQHPH